MDALICGVVSVVGVVLLAVEPLCVPKTSVDAAPVFCGDRLTAQRYHEGKDEFCHGVALPCAMVSAVHLGDRSDNSNLGVSYVPNSESSCGFRDNNWCFSRDGYEANVQNTRDTQALSRAS